ncbi:hypothetical protein FRC12_008728 [Ceratobasidium sp. 428]|nr:hypothetical protein FRC12_008728 [Ceratobasidium sp. 428]
MEPEGANEPGGTHNIFDLNLADVDEDTDLRNDLPPSFSELEEKHFPLFISFDKLCSLIEADIHRVEQKKKREIWSAKPTLEHKFIDYKEFTDVYWPQFRSSDRFGLSPSLVYSEILGVIRGYSELMGCAGGYLGRDHHILGSLANRVSAHLDVGVKGQIYSISEDYRRLKGARFELDRADRSHRISEFITRGMPKDDPDFRKDLLSIDCLYVDEVQDNLMSDIRLLRQLCKTLENTYWGGDTAQTILAGSAFQIKDLGAYLYNQVQENLGDNIRRLPPKLAPSKFALTVNYRSHKGIVRCAASIVAILYELFPESLDELPIETADDTSIRHWPTVVTDASSQDDAFKGFLEDLTSSLGAQQAILVRSEEQAKQLKSQIAGFCPVLTIAKSKGKSS